MLASIARGTSKFMQAIMPSMASVTAAPSMAPYADFWYQSAGLPGMSSMQGGDEAYEFVSTCYAATQFLAGIGSTIPINLTKTEKTKSGETVSNILFDDPRQALMNQRTNKDQHAMSARSMGVVWQINRGTGFLEVQRDSFTKMPVAMWPIYPTRCRHFYNESGDLYWHVRNSDGSESDIADVDMFRVPNTMLSPNGLTGIGVADRAFQQIQLGQSLDRTENDASMSGVPRIVVESERPMTMPEQDAFRRQWKELYVQGGEGVALLVGKMTAKPLGWSAVDSDFVARRDRHQLTIASLYNIPPILLQLLVDPSADPEKLLQMFQKCGLKWLNMWVQEANEKLLTEAERKQGYGWKIDYQSLLEADPSGRADYYSRLFPLGVFSSNDILQSEGKNPYPEGHRRFVQGAMRPIDEPYNANLPQNPPMDPTGGKRDPLKPPKTPKPKAIEMTTLKAGARTMLEDCIRRLTHKEAVAATRAAKKPDEWMTWIDSFYADHEPWAVSELKMPLEVCSVFGVTDKADSLASSLVGQSKTALLDVADGERSTFVDRVELLVAGWEQDRASAAVKAIAELN